MQFYSDMKYDYDKDIDKENKYNNDYYYTLNEKDKYNENNELEKYEEKYGTLQDDKNDKNDKYYDYMSNVIKNGISEMLKQFFNPSEQMQKYEINYDVTGYVHLYNMIKKIDIKKICSNEIKNFIICGFYYAKDNELINYIKEIVKKNEWYLSRQELILHNVESPDYQEEIYLINVFHEALRTCNIDKINALYELGLLDVFRDELVKYDKIPDLFIDTFIKNPNDKEQYVFIKRLFEIYNITTDEIQDSVIYYNHEIEEKLHSYNKKISKKDCNKFIKTFF